jgi:hypothetical protein
MPSAVTTQRASPVNLNITLAEGLAMAAAPEPAPEPAPVAAPGMMTNAIVAKPSLQDLVDAPTAYCKLDIIKKIAHTANYNPAMAIPNLNASLQLEVGAVLGFDIPANLYHISFVEPQGAGGSDGTVDLGSFECGMAAPLLPYVVDLTNPKNPAGPLAFTGDDDGNNYKLTYRDYTPPTTGGKKIRTDTYYLLLKPQKGHGLTRRELYEATNAHFAKYGMTIDTHSDAFKIKDALNKEMGSNAWHVEYKLDRAKIPMDDECRYNVEGLQLFELDTDQKHTCSVSIKPELLYKIFNACGKCWKNRDGVCLGHGPPAPSAQPGAGKKMTAAQNTEAAKKRLAKRAKTSFAFE